MLLFLLPLALSAQIQTVTGNFPRDMCGPADTRPNTWGRAEAVELPIKFKAPAGTRVRIRRLRGDLVSWALIGACASTNDKTMLLMYSDTLSRFSGLLVGFSTTAQEGSKKCDWCADNTLLYVQDALHGTEARRTPFNWKMNRLLEPDNILVLKIATWLNTIGPIHVEATWQADFEWVK